MPRKPPVDPIPSEEFAKPIICGLVAIIGRPNVGKSTLFNRLTRSKTSIIDDQPGVTRDRIYGQAFYDKRVRSGFTVIDTGGFETKDFNFQPFADNLVWQQTEMAIQEADLIILVMDAKSGLHQHDQQLLRYCEQLKKPYICVVNKIDGQEKISEMFEFFALGINDCLPISAAHSKGINDLLSQIKSSLSGLRRLPQQIDFELATKIALIGKPNAGKSSILNRLVGQKRSLVSEVAGSTRDSIDTPYTYNKKPYVIIDTAGIRRKTRITEALETQSVIRSLQAIDRADIVVLVLDAISGITDQDSRLINLAIDRGKPVLLVINKWDLVPDKGANTAKQYETNIHERYLKELSFLPILTISCTENQRVHKIMDKVEMLLEQYQNKVPTARLNECLRKSVDRHTPQLISNHSKRVKFYFATQVRTAPPTFVIMCNVSDEVQESYKRYLLRQFQKDLGFPDVPIQLIFRGKKEAESRRSARLMNDPEWTAQKAQAMSCAE